MIGGVRNSVIKPRQLRLARESLELSVEEVSRSIRVPLEQLRDWESGVVEPPVEQLWELAALYGRDVDYFLEDTKPFPVRIAFRLDKPHRMKDLSLEARKTLTRFEELCRSEMELEGILERQRRVRIEKLAWSQDPGRLASSVRQDFGFGERPGKNLRERLEQLGIRVFELDVPENVFSGFSWWHSEYGPCILANYGDVSGRRAFTESHEFAHLLVGHEPGICDVHVRLGTGEERFANDFAAAFLMPSDDVEHEFWLRGLQPGPISESQLGALSTRYGVSLEAMGRKLESLDFLPKGFTDSWVEQRGTLPVHFRRPKFPRWRKQLGEPFTILAREAYSRGLISLETLAHYLGVNMREALHFGREDLPLDPHGATGR